MKASGREAAGIPGCYQCVFSVFSGVREERRRKSLQGQDPLASFAAHCNRRPLEKGLSARFGLGDSVPTD